MKKINESVTEKFVQLKINARYRGLGLSKLVCTAPTKSGCRQRKTDLNLLIMFR